MKSTAKVQRNRAIVLAIDSKKATFKGLSRELGLGRKTLREIYWREKLRDGAKNVPLWVQKKYPKLSTPSP